MKARELLHVMQVYRACNRLLPYSKLSPSVLLGFVSQSVS